MLLRQIWISLGLLALVPGLATLAQERLAAPARDDRPELSQEVLVRGATGTEVAQLAATFGAGKPRRLVIGQQELFIFTLPRALPASVIKSRQTGYQGVASLEILPSRQWQKKFLPNDPRFSQQWNLLNTGQNGGTPKVDLNVTNVWETWQGGGVIIGIVDDGLALDHPDLASNVNLNLGYDYFDHDPDPSPGFYSDTHGTQVAGLAAARGNNAIGISGTAPQATLAGIRLISGATTDAQDAAALLHASQSIQIMNCSWGANDSTGDFQGPGPLARAALREGAETGRGGRGTIYVFAAGNGRASGDDANQDGFANSIYTLTVGAVTDQGLQAGYSEGGACVQVVAPSSGTLRQTITTTDRPGAEGDDPGDYTADFGGTSAAVPAVSGVMALMLQANPNLGWRDVQEILMRTARKMDAANAGWITNGAGFPFHDGYGAGLVDAAGAVRLAGHWQNLPAQTNLALLHTNVNWAIPDNNPAGLTIEWPVSNALLRVEHAALTVSFSHPNRSELEIELISPQGTISRLLSAGYLASAEHTEWTFTSVRHWGEMAAGNWRVRIADTQFLQLGQVHSLQLDLYGAAPAPPTLAIATTNQNIVVAVTAPPPLRPRLEASTNLQSWQEVPLPFSANGVFLYTVPPPVPQQQYFRARLTPP